MSTPAINQSRATALLQSQEMQQWLAKGRGTNTDDGEGNSLTLLEALAQSLFDSVKTAVQPADLAVALQIVDALRGIGRTHSRPAMPRPSYGAPEPPPSA
jgi:hypothetical protein